MEDQIRRRNMEIADMRRAMIAAGMLRNEEARFRDMDEDEAESPMMSQSTGARGGPNNRSRLSLHQLQASYF